MKEKLKTYPALRRGVIGASIMFLLALWGFWKDHPHPLHFYLPFPCAATRHYHLYRTR